MCFLVLNGCVSGQNRNFCLQAVVYCLTNTCYWYFFISIFVYVWCIHMYMHVCVVWRHVCIHEWSCTCVWRPKITVRNQPSLGFHIVARCWACVSRLESWCCQSPQLAHSEDLSSDPCDLQEGWLSHLSSCIYIYMSSRHPHSNFLVVCKYFNH